MDDYQEGAIDDVTQDVDDEYETSDDNTSQADDVDVQDDGGKADNDTEVLKRRLEMTEQQLEYFRELLRQNQDIIAMFKNKDAKEEKDPLDDIDPEEPLTAKQLKLVQKKMLEDSKKMIQDVETRYKRSLAAISEKAARLRYEDYDDVIKYAIEMAQQDPVILQKIATSDDPAEEAYQWGLRNPRYIEQIKSKTKKDVTDKIKNNLSKTSNAVPNRGRNIPKKDPFEMTPEEFAQYKRKVLGD